MKDKALLILISSVIFLFGCSEAPEEKLLATIEAPTKDVVTTEISEPTPINAVLMLSSPGHWWTRKPPEENWKLVFVWCDAKNFLPYTVYLDSAMVEINGQSEEVFVDVTLGTELEDRYNGEILIYTTAISGIPFGDYLLHVTLLSSGNKVCEREDIISLQ